MPVSKPGQTPVQPHAPARPEQAPKSTGPQSTPSPAPPVAENTETASANEQAGKRRDLAVTESLNRTRVGAAETAANEIKSITDDRGFKALPEATQKKIQHELNHPETRAQLLEIKNSETYRYMSTQQRAKLLQKFADADGPTRSQMVTDSTVRSMRESPFLRPRPSGTVYINDIGAHRKDDSTKHCE